MLCVRAFLLLCKLNSYKLSDKALFDAFMSKIDLSHMACPSCGSKGRHILYSSYERSMISLEEGERRDLVVTIPRIRCSCGHTHAVLPDVLIPYGSYSLRFILTVLFCYLTRHVTVEELCSKFQIVKSTLYSWIHLFIEHFNLLAGILRSIDALNLDALEWVNSFDGFSFEFYNRFKFSFLQTHRAATRCNTN